MVDLLLVPPLAKDARSRVIAELAARVSHIDLSPVLVYLIDSVDASVLPYLAEQFNVLDEGWQVARPDDEKRRLLHKAIDLHRHKGTKWAVENALDVLGLRCSVQEWFEYGGAPYFFRASFVTENGLPEDFYTTGIDRAVELITRTKNVRSWLEAITIVLAVAGQAPRVGVGLYCGETITLYPAVQTEFDQHASVPRVGLGMQIVEAVTLHPKTTNP